jgi:hypothetical protein
MRPRSAFAPVAHAHPRVLVLASGPSGAGPWPAHPGVPVIAVNGAIDGLAWAPDYWITLDPSPANLARLTPPRAGTCHYLAVDGDYGPAARRERMRHDFDALGVHLLLRQHGMRMADDPRVIHTGNSGRAGIQLALHMVRAFAPLARVGVFGVDATAHDYWHAPGQRSGDLANLPGLLRHVHAPGVEIRFADCQGSRVAGQRKAPAGEVLGWLRE